MVGTDLSGAVLDGRYRLTSLLGAGGMGQVYEAMHLALDRKVAVKVLPGQLSEDMRFRARFAREARAAAKISHRNVVQIMDFGESPEGPVYFVMEFLEGRDLGALLRGAGRLPWPRARHLLLQATSAIKAAHTHGIIHRDIKPGNCVVLDLPLEGLTDVVKLLDFGIAKVMAEAEKEGSTMLKPLTVTGEMMGTASYMSPEQARCEAMDVRSDVYSLGIMAYEMLTGRVPFTGINPVHVATRHLFDRPDPLHRVVPDILPDVEAIVLRALAKEPERRFQSMAELEAALAAVREVSIESVPTRVLSAVGVAGRVTAGRAGTGDRLDKPTIDLHTSETRVEPRVAEDSFEDAETPDPLVLVRRFGEPYPVPPRVSEEPEEVPIDVEEEEAEARGDELAEVDAVTSARIRLVPDAPPGSVDAVVSIQESVIELVAATTPSLEAETSEHVPMASPVAELPMERADDWSLPRLEPEVEGASPSIEGTMPRRARSKGWAVGLGLVVALGGFAAIAKLVTSGAGAEPPAEAIAGGEVVEPIDSFEQPPTPLPVEADVLRVEPDESALAKPAEPELAEQRGTVPGSAQEGPASKASTPLPNGSHEPAMDDANEPARAGVPEPPDPSAETAETAETPSARAPKQKRHESRACQILRDRAYRAHEAGEYSQIVRLAAPGHCWPSSLKLDRLKMHQNALFETRQFTQCVAAGEGISDLSVMQLSSKCQTRLQKFETTSKKP